MSGATVRNVFGNRLNIAHVLANSPPQLDQVLPGLVAGTVGMLVGAGGIGKTMLELQIAISVAAGLTHHDGLLGAGWGEALPPEPCRVVFVAAEEPVEVIWSRVHHIVHGLNQRNVLPDDMNWVDFRRALEANLHIYPLAGAERVQLIDESLAPTSHMNDLHAIAAEARLVILDPLRQFHLEDENSSTAMSAMLSAFKQLAHRTGSAVVFAHHASRASAQYGYANTADASRGSTALTSDARWQLNMATPTKDQLKHYGLSDEAKDTHVLLNRSKGNYVASGAPLLMRRTVGGVLVPVEAFVPQEASKRRVA